MRIERYSFWKIILLSLITFGIYGIYKNYKWTKDVNTLCQGVGNDSLNYIVVLLLSIITFGIYGIVWIYLQTERLKETGDINGVQVEDTGAQNLLLLLLTGPIGAMVVWYILYDNTNRLSSVYNGDLPREYVNSFSSHKTPITIAVVAAILSVIISVGVVVAGILGYVFSNDGDHSIIDNMPFIDEEEIIPGENFIPGQGIWPDDFFDEDAPENDVWEDVPYGSDYKDIGESGDLDTCYVVIGDMTKDYGFTGNPAIVVNLSWTNKGEVDASALWRLYVNAYQKGKELETTWPDAFNDNVSMDSYLKNIAPGETIEFQVMFDVDNMTDPITIEVTEFQGKSKIKLSKTFLLEDQEA